ncbi:hypothetical protein PTKIN_Ptkin08bG0014600 [Pterospermum kingtungense]
MFGSTRYRNVDKHCLRTSKFKGRGPFVLTEDRCLGMLMRFDSDKDGRLSKEDVKNAFKDLGLSPPNNKTFASLSDVDENGNRYIGEDQIGELVKYVMKRG